MVSKVPTWTFSYGISCSLCSPFIDQMSQVDVGREMPLYPCTRATGEWHSCRPQEASKATQQTLVSLTQ